MWFFFIKPKPWGVICEFILDHMDGFILFTSSRQAAFCHFWPKMSSVHTPAGGHLKMPARLHAMLITRQPADFASAPLGVRELGREKQPLELSVEPNIWSLLSFNDQQRVITKKSRDHSIKPILKVRLSLLSSSKGAIITLNWSRHKIKDTSVSKLEGILGSDPAPHILSTEIFPVWRIGRELRSVLVFG